MIRRFSLIVAVALVAACTPGGGERDAPAPSGEEAMSAPARWVEVTRPRGRELLEASARVVTAPGAAAELTVLFPAQVKAVKVAPGDRVEAGAPLASVVMPELNQAAAELKSSSSHLALLRARLEQLEALEKEGLAKRAEVFEVQQRVAELTARRDRARAQLGAQGLSGRHVDGVLRSGRLTLRAPIAGVVTEVSMKMGEVVTPDGSPLAHILGEAAARVEATLTHALPEEVELEFVDIAGRRYGVDAEPLSGVTVPETGAHKAWFRFDPPQRLAAGLRGSLRVVTSSGSFVVVPANAVVLRGDRAYVFTRDGDAPKKIPVRVVMSTGATAVVSGALEPGDRVLADGSAAPEPETGDAT